MQMRVLRADSAQVLAFDEIEKGLRDLKAQRIPEGVACERFDSRNGSELVH